MYHQTAITNCYYHIAFAAAILFDSIYHKSFYYSK